MQAIKLKEHIGLENYNWKSSLLTYELCEDFEKGPYCLICNDETLPCQITDKGNGKYSVAFVTDLNSGEEKEFVFEKSDKNFDEIARYDGDALILQNENIKITVDEKNDELFKIENPDSDFAGISTVSKAVKRKTVKLEENGPVYAVAKISVLFEDDESYEVLLKLIRKAEYIVMYEDISANNTMMQIQWQGFKPEFRFNPGNRGQQPVDHYVRKNNEMPVVVVPHDMTNGSADTNFITFYDDKNSVGAFVGESIKWNDGRFSIEGNNRINALRFFNNEEKDSGLVFKYPLNKGTRETCIAIYKSEKCYNSKLKTHIRELQFWNYYLPLNSYKDWIFEYDDSEEKYPVYYDINYYKDDEKYYFCDNDGNGVPPANKVLSSLENMQIIKDPWHFGPVWSRCLCEFIPFLDMRANELSEEEFKRCRNICILYAYYAMNENTFPTRHTLSGHPNFFMDYVSIIGFAAGMFPKHPDAKKWKDYYERTVLLLLRFHIRPDVKSWKSKGGRATENLGCYSWVALKHIVEVGAFIEASYDDHPALHPNYVKWAEWYLNALSAPIKDGRRVFPPLGAHAGGHILNPYYPTFFFRAMGEHLKNYAPLLAEQIYNVCPPKPLYQLESFTANLPSSYINENTDVENTGIKPHLKSEKFTGYGYIMRSHVNEENEMCVFLQQIDEGPNYRWGGACEGGCGNIYYYADNKRYSDNRKEDVGDDSMVDGSTSCTFTVLSKVKTFKSVGQNEITYPLIDFGFCQYSRVNAGEYSNNEYRYRSVLMADNDYIAIYDAVRDSRTHGKFSWFSNVSDDMPYIHQLKPGLKAREVLPPELTLLGNRFDNVIYGEELPFNHTRGVMYDGRGDFFTVVTHKDSLNIENKEYGAIIKNKGTTDYVFDVPYSTIAEEDNIKFSGKVGFVRLYNNDQFDMAIIEGNSLKFNDTQMNIEGISEYFSASLSKREDRIFGKCEGHGVIELTIDNLAAYKKLYINNKPVDITSNSLRIELCDATWEITANDPTPCEVNNIKYVENEKGVEITWSDCNALEYVVKVNDKEYVTTDTNLQLSLNEGKYIVNIVAKNNNIFGKMSMDYPMYIRKDKPVKVEGLRLTRRKDLIDIVWGEQLGVEKYNLYKVVNGKISLIYSGIEHSYKEYEMNDNAEYYVTAQNGYGESDKSLSRDTIPGGTADWDPLPDEGFVRETISNEHGWAGFDFQRNEQRTILKYPD